MEHRTEISGAATQGNCPRHGSRVPFVPRDVFSCTAATVSILRDVQLLTDVSSGRERNDTSGQSHAYSGLGGSP